MDAYPLPTMTQLVGDRLLVADREARLLDVGNASPLTIWSGGLDGAAIGFDGSVWISAVGSSEQHGYWSALLRAPVAGDDPTALATSRQPMKNAVRFLPVACGDRLLVLRGKLVRSRLENNSLARLRNDSGALRLGGSIGLDLYRPDGTLQQTLGPVHMRRLVSIGCDQNGLTLVDRSLREHEYVGVAF